MFSLCLPSCGLGACGLGAWGGVGAGASVVSAVVVLPLAGVTGVVAAWRPAVAVVAVTTAVVGPVPVVPHYP